MPADWCPAEWLLDRANESVGCAICAVLRGMLAYAGLHWPPLGLRVFCTLAVANGEAASPCC